MLMMRHGWDKSHLLSVSPECGLTSNVKASGFTLSDEHWERHR